MATKEMQELKAALAVAGENRQWLLETKIFSFIRREYLSSERVTSEKDLCAFFEIDFSEYLTWRGRHTGFSEGQMRRIRRRIEDRLRKSDTSVIIKIAEELGVSLV